MSAELARAAFRLAMKGIPVFPLKPGTKEPAVSGGLHAATSDPDAVRAWWNKWPDANLSIPTGPHTNVWVLDIDGAEGEASLSRLEGEHGPLPDTSGTVTGTGGRHLYFAWPTDGPEIRNSAGRIGQGLDVRGAGGSIIVPPSIHPNGRPYRWTGTDRGFADAPAWLVEVAAPPPPARTDPSPVDGDISRYAAAAITDELNRLAEATEGHRNDQLNRSAFAVASFVRAGVAPEDWARALLEERAVGIGLSAIEARGTIDSAFKSARPRKMPL